MNQQQSFHPLLSNATLYDRMFRNKPYTKCIQCLANEKLKCRKCMENIIQEITKNENSKRQIKTREKSQEKENVKCGSVRKEHPSANRCLSVNRIYTRESKQSITITSKYNWWLAERIRKRQFDVSLKKNWPRKIKSNQINFDNFGATQPRFQRWEKKLIDQLMPKPTRE